MPKKSPQKKEVATNSRTTLQFRSSEKLRDFFRSSPDRMKGSGIRVRNMRQYLIHLAMSDGYVPCADDF